MTLRVKRLLLVAGVALTIGGLSHLWIIARSTAGMDFYQFWVGAAVAGREDVPHFYDESSRHRIGREYVRRALTEERSVKRLAVARYREDLETMGTPFLYSVMPPAGTNYDRDLLGFEIAVIAALAGGIVLFAYVYGVPVWAALLVLGFVTLFWEPVASEVQVGNVNAMTLLMLAFAAVALQARRHALAGAILAASTLFKPTMLAVLPLLVSFEVVARRWRELSRLVIGAGVTAVAIVALTSWRFRSATVWIEWATELRRAAPGMARLEQGNFSLPALVAAATGFNAGWWILIVAIAIFAIAARRAVREGVDVERYAIPAGALISLLAAPLAWLHYFILTIPALLLLTRTSRAGTVVAVSALAILTVRPWDPLVAEVTTVASIVNVAVMALLAMMLRDVLPGRDRQPVP